MTLPYLWAGKANRRAPLWQAWAILARLYMQNRLVLKMGDHGFLGWRSIELWCPGCTKTSQNCPCKGKLPANSKIVNQYSCIHAKTSSFKSRWLQITRHIALVIGN
jgi:hypothetical protein